jgi:hypothetical protein
MRWWKSDNRSCSRSSLCSVREHRVSGRFLLRARSHAKTHHGGVSVMNMFMKRWACVYAALIFMLLAAPRYAEAMRFEYSASQDGFNFKYRVPFFGFGRVALADQNAAPEDIPVRFLFIKLATIQLSIASVNPDAQPPNLILHFDVTSRFSSSTISRDMRVPFGDGGIRIKFFRKWLLWTKGNDADIRLLLNRKKTKAVFDFDMPELQGTWKDEANSQDNQILLSITDPVTQLTFADISMTFSYPATLFTKVNYAITVTPNPATAPDNSSNFDGDLFLPNGSYHAWFNVAQ